MHQLVRRFAGLVCWLGRRYELVFHLSVWDDDDEFAWLQALARERNRGVLRSMRAIRDAMADESDDGSCGGNGVVLELSHSSLSIVRTTTR